MRVALVHDYLAQAGGAERVLEAMHGIWPDAPIFTAIYDPDATLPTFRQMEIRTSNLQRLFGRERLHRFGLPLYPAAFRRFDLRAYDVIVSSSNSFAKCVRPAPGAIHICYCHAPARYLWNFGEYADRGGTPRGTRFLLSPMIRALRTVDRAAAQKVDMFVTNSRNMAERIRTCYARDAIVLPAPVRIDRFRIAPAPRSDSFLIVSRLVGYKRIDLAVAACTRHRLPLTVIGTGPEASRLRAMAGPTVQLLGRRPDAEVAERLSHCTALLLPGREDFGITPLEAMASGRPVVAYRGGGALETVLDGTTGVFFDDPEPDACFEAMRRVRTIRFDPPKLREHAATFDLGAFQTRLRALVERYDASGRRPKPRNEKTGNKGSMHSDSSTFLSET